MEGEYPRFKSSYLQEELAEALQLGPWNRPCARAEQNHHVEGLYSPRWLLWTAYQERPSAERSACAITFSGAFRPVQSSKPITP